MILERIILCFGVVTSFASAVNWWPQSCPGNELFQKCGPGCGDLTCRNYEHPPVCHEECKPGCYCPPGCVRDDENKCVLIKTCVKCGPNEHYESCGSMCGDFNCENPTFADRICPAGCKKGCFCDKGFVRGPDGKCIPYKECFKLCTRAHELFTQCGANCEKHCNDPFNLDPICPDTCESGCVCKDGYLRKNKKCVPIHKCRRHECKKKRHQTYLECGFPCERSCDRLEPFFCHKACGPGCFCKQGYVRDDHGECIKPKHCNQECGKDEIFQVCGPPCGDLTCKNFNHPPECHSGCHPGCYCREGCVRNKHDECVPITECENWSK